MFAVIKASGKQYLVSPNDTLKIDKIPGEVGHAVVFDQVLLVAEADGTALQIGQPLVSGAKVTATIVEQFRDKKVVIVKFKQKTHYRRTKGHRQHVTKLKIDGIK